MTVARYLKLCIALVCLFIASLWIIGESADISTADINYARELFTHKEYCKALSYGSTLTAFYPHRAQTWYAYAYFLKELNYYQEACVCYQRALECDSRLAGTHIGYAQALLALGNLHDGFKELLWRFEDPFSINYERLKYYIHDHKTLHTVKILIRGEWGKGDVFQFIRYARLLKQLGAIVIVDVQPDLIPLLSLCPYIDIIIKPGDTLPSFHYEIPLLSLPLVFKTTVSTIPCTVPYLYAPTDLIEFWRKQLAHDKNFKIGICWHGNTIHNEQKFIPLSQLLALSSIPGVSLYSLQKIDGLAQLDTRTTFSLIIPQPSLDGDHGPFMDTAAVMKVLDLIITVDTSLAHLAGALDVPVWVILPYHADWRWMIERNDSPWYPSMKLFRQSNPHHWNDVIDSLKYFIKEKLHVTTADSYTY